MYGVAHVAEEMAGRARCHQRNMLVRFKLLQAPIYGCPCFRYRADCSVFTHPALLLLATACAASVTAPHLLELDINPPVFIDGLCDRLCEGGDDVLTLQLGADQLRDLRLHRGDGF